jgi:hypothetical protein
MRARRTDITISHVEGAGHVFSGDYKLAEETMALRHYVVRDQEHAYQKYTGRKFPADELAIGWHTNRHGQPRQSFTFPPAHALKALSTPDSRDFDRSAPFKTHYWQWPRPILRSAL